MSRNDYFTTGSLLDFLHHWKFYKIIDVDLSRQTNAIIPQQFNFTRKLEKDGGVTLFFIAEVLF